MRLSLTALTRGIGSLDGSIDVEVEQTSRDHFSKFISVARAKRLINPRYCLSSSYIVTDRTHNNIQNTSLVSSLENSETQMPAHPPASGYQASHRTHR
jgi:hypothetical protein